MVDPSQDRYIKRLDTDRIIQSEDEYKECLEHHIPLKIISYNSALDTLKKQRAVKVAKCKARAHNKKARKQRRVNNRG